MSSDPSGTDTSWEQVAADELRPALAALELRLRHFRLRQLHFTGDLTLRGFLLGAWSGARAALHLVSASEFGFAAFPNVRSAFEAAQDAMLLVTESDYNKAGARARVFERLEYADLKVEMHDAFGTANAPEPSRDYAEAVRDIKAYAAKWDADCPGRGSLLLEALNDLQAQFEGAKTGKRHPGHWAGLSRRRIAIEISKRVDDPAFAKGMIAAYAHLSRNSHPRVRLDTWERYVGSDGAKRFRGSGRSLRIALGVAAVATHMAVRAFDHIKASELPQSDG